MLKQSLSRLSPIGFLSCIAAICLLVSPAPVRSAPIEPPRTKQEPAHGMRVFATKYYIIHTDLDTDAVKEAVIRMSRMAEEYHARTQGFSGEIRERLPFYLFKTPEEYYAAGGLPGSAGVFNGSSLMAIAGDDTNGETWHVVQHEGFHQFAHAVIRGELPTWLNEGIAEYFGESIFTGDGFVTGVIPPYRLKRLKAEITGGKLKSIKDMMYMSHEEWNSRLTIENYDQAWSMVHFLAQGESGRYQNAFVTFMKMIGRGTPWPMAWKQTFGDASGFEQHWKDYWMNQPANPTSDLYLQAMTATFTSFLARATAEKQNFGDFDQFISAAGEGNIKLGQTIEDWLPPKLLAEAVKVEPNAPATWTIDRSPTTHEPELLCLAKDGLRLTGSFVVSGSHATHVSVELDDTASVLAQAQALIAEGKKDPAHELLRGAMRSHPKSPLIEEVRKLMQQTR